MTNLNTPESDFRQLYPDVDPGTPIPPTIGERIALTAATAVLAFGGASGDLIITGAGLALLLLTLVTSSRKTPRRIRSEARDRFPAICWAENQASADQRLNWALPATWVAIVAICLTTLWLIPVNYTLTGATVAALISAALIWFVLGLAPRRSALEEEWLTSELSQPVQ